MTEKVTSTSYPTAIFGRNVSMNTEIAELFQNLQNLPSMDKNGPMSGRCGPQTDQMEQFLKQTFGFQNIPEYIVQGVRSFKLDHPPETMDSHIIINFPSEEQNLFQMSVEEIRHWQRSYKVYADQNIHGMNKNFLFRALQGLSSDGEEAFRMKFVIRISTCPILMEFDANIISRQLNDAWPNRIKLVSVSGIDFAGRNHDIGDILYYISNWRKVFTIDPNTDLPFVFNGRDFVVGNGQQRAKIYKKRVWNSLKRMTRLRLLACDREGVQIVVETGIGLGVFAGSHIGIDETIKTLSAKAIRTVLEEDQSVYKNIRAVIFALPMFNNNNNNNQSTRRIRDTYHIFVKSFRKPKYRGRIPVLIADQDMHRLTVAIARLGYIVSELNPADSHGVFGEYWQNRGPAVEEKLALTTVGLLVQHHLINPEVHNTDNYQILEVNGTEVLNYRSEIENSSKKFCC